MERVDFYIIDEGEDYERWRFACRLTEKAWARGHRVYLHAGSPSEARAIDDWLWTFRQESFVPHDLATDPGAEASPVRIGSGSPPPGDLEVVINLAPDAITFGGRCRRLAEVIGPGDDERQAGRERYRQYRRLGLTVHSHSV